MKPSSDPADRMTEEATRAAILAWQAEGREISDLTARLLIAQASAVDRAMRGNSAAAITTATRGYSAWLRDLGLDHPPTPPKPPDVDVPPPVETIALFESIVAEL